MEFRWFEEQIVRNGATKVAGVAVLQSAESYQ